jgi:hypothetical protein
MKLEVMADQLYLSYKLRGYTLTNMLRHYERMLRVFPFSKLWQSGSQLRINAVSWSEPPLIETEFPHPPDIEAVLAAAKEFPLADCAVQLETRWDLWQYDGDWKVEPSRVVLMCFGPQFEDEVDDNLCIDFGIDSLFLPNPDIPNNALMTQSNIRSLLHLVHELDNTLAVETRRLWTESGENFAERLQATLESMPA